MTFEIYRTSDAFRGERPHRNAKQLDDVTWVIEVNTLDELLALMKEEGCSIVLHDWASYGYPMIEIYDDYRE